ncbi:MAG: J domain-containing protein [Desulfocapsaceae bacterium]|nr:J domain-containing protein [Desulfocapsaceae bacterium]
MTQIGQLSTEKSIETAMKEIREWLSKININGLNVDLRHDANINVAILRFKYQNKDYEFISRKHNNCRLNMWGIARVIEWRIELEGHADPQVKETPINELNYAKLGLSMLASTREVQDKYRSLIKTYHPDMVNSQEAKLEFEKRAKEINQAYSEIMKERGIK